MKILLLTLLLSLSLSLQTYAFKYCFIEMTIGKYIEISDGYAFPNWNGEKLYVVMYYGNDFTSKVKDWFAKNGFEQHIEPCIIGKPTTYRTDIKNVKIYRNL